MRFKKILALGVASIALAGCTSNAVVNAEKAAKNDMESAAKWRDVARQPLPVANVSPVSVNEGVWLGATAITSDNGTPLPEAFEHKGITLVSSEPLNLWEITSEITNITGIPVSLDVNVVADLTETAEAEEENASSGADSTSLSPGADIFLAADGMPGGAAVSGAAGGSGGASPAVDATQMILMDVNWNGSLSGLLNLVASRYNISWEYENGVINIYKYATKTFSLAAMPTTSAIKSSLDSGTAGPGSGQGSGEQSSTQVDSLQAASSEFQIKIWDEVAETVAGMVNNNGSYSISPSLGTITVTAPKQVVKQVEKYVEHQNASLTKQVALSVKVLAVKTSEADSYGFNPSVFFKPLSDNPVFNFTYGGGYNPITGAGSLAWGILNPNPTSGASRWTDGGETSTNAAIETLATLGNVSVVTSASVTTLNNIPAPVQVAAQKAYLREIAVTSDGEGATTTEMTPGSVTTGFSMHVLPRVHQNGTIQLQYGVSISELLEMAEYVSPDGSSSVQLPEVEARSFTQQALLKSGATLVLAGYEKVSNTADKSGNFEPEMIFPFGGTHKGEQSKNVIVIMITPVVLDANGMALKPL